MSAITIKQDWISDEGLQRLLELLTEGGEEARIAGGAVRNALQEKQITDVDIATTLLPQDVIDRVEEAGLRAIPTGIEHGTVTVLVDGTSYEITTLRQDIKTDGRHAVVEFGRDWEEDASRRDFTMNALYANADGSVFDPLNGYEDVLRGNVRFIGNAESRIREDGLRMLRFFRFFAWYGQFRPDADGLKACVRMKDRLSDLSAERVWQELAKMLAAPDPTRAVLWMRQTSVLNVVLPESENWGIDNLAPLIEAENEYGWEPDALLRLISIIPPMEERVATMVERLKLPNRVRDRLKNWAESGEPDLSMKRPQFHEQLYRGSVSGMSDRLRMSVVREKASGNEKLQKKAAKRLKQAEKYKRPELPVKGQDLLDRGFEPGPKISETLRQLEETWIGSGFKLNGAQLLNSL